MEAYILRHMNLRHYEELEIRAFDAADYLKTPEIIAEYVRVVAEETENNSKFVVMALRSAIRAHHSLLREGSCEERYSDRFLESLPEDVSPAFETIVNVARVIGLKVRFEIADESKSR